MAKSIKDTLAEIQNWYDQVLQADDVTAENDRAVMLSKLALLELCGWIEGEFDEIIRLVNQKTIKDYTFTTETIRNTNGFEYEKHFKPMLIKYLGEFTLRAIEANLLSAQDFDLGIFKSNLGTLWVKRCALAHADLIANLAATQKSYEAPSWSLSRYTALSKMISAYKTAIETTLQPTNPPAG